MTQQHPYEDDLKAYFDGELSWFARMAVARHLARCASCRMEIAQMSQITDELRPDTSETLDPTLRAKILSDLGPNSTSPVRVPRYRPTPLLIGAAGVVLAYCIFMPVFSKSRSIARNVSYEQVASAPTPAHTKNKQIRLGQTQYSEDNDSTYRPQHTFNGLGAPPAQTVDKNGNVEAHIKYPESRYEDLAKRRAPSAPLANMPAPAVVSGNIDGDAAIRQVHNEASIGVEVANAETASADLEGLVKGVGGYVAQNALNSDEDGKRSADITVKVPVDQFDSIMTQIGKFGKVTEKSVNGEDITEKTSDANQRETIMEDEVRRTNAILKTRGKRATWSDQEEAREMRIQLAQSRARLQLLRKMARLSDIEVTLSEKTKVETPKVTSTFWTNLTASTGAATDSLASAFGRVLALIIWIVAYAPIWVPALLAYRWWVKKNKREESAA